MLRHLVSLLFVLLLQTVAAERPYVTGFGHCPGYTKYPYQWVSGRLPAVINAPGTFSLDFSAKTSQDLPDDLVVRFKIKKFEPITYDVPCIGGLGACEYDVCVDEYFTKELCANFPPSQPCKCPIKAGEIQLKDLQITVPDPGYFAYVMSGTYEGRAILSSKSDAESVYGCVAFAIKIEAKQLPAWLVNLLLFLVGFTVLWFWYSVLKRCCRRKSAAPLPKKQD